MVINCVLGGIDGDETHVVCIGSDDPAVRHGDGMFVL